MNSPASFGPVPSQRQLRWHAMEFYGFIHFTVNTFTNREMGYGDESPSDFNPTDFDADRIAETAAQGGMTGLILTCKHHDGFCLWPSRFTEHSVRHSPWRHGRGDVVRELSDACANHGLKFGVYLSPWDRNHPEYGKPAYNFYYREQLKELLTEYGPLFEIWFDGCNGGDGYYGGAKEKREIDRHSYYDWDHVWNIVRELQPDACIFSDDGPDIRWVGNETGIAGDPCWNTMDRGVFVPGDADLDVLNAGQHDGSDWVPAECDVSIRPSWFYHPEENDKVRSPDNLLDLYFKSVGRGAALHLNLPPDPRGRIHENDTASLLEFRKRLDGIFSTDLARNARATSDHVRGNDPRFDPANLLDGKPDTYWSTDDEVTRPEVVVGFSSPVTFNVIRLREYLPLGQRIDRFALDVDDNGTWSEIATGTGIGNQRLVQTPTHTTDRIRLRITEAPVCPALLELAVFMNTTAFRDEVVAAPIL